MRRTIADRLTESYQNAVHVTVSRELDAEPLLDRADSAGADVGLIDALLAAVSATLSDHPAFNATFEDGTHRIYEEHNIGVAVDIDAGLVTPVIGSVDQTSLPEIASERRRLTERMQAGDYTMSDFRGGTFTVSNLGPLGSGSFTPIINPPEIAILGVNRIRERPRQGEDGSVTFRKTITVDLSFDHRVVDGAAAARFLDTLAGHVKE
jgi:pyruvate dehydrogenase E2 component (dihydrolipoamide acetyltransferase)